VTNADELANEMQRVLAAYAEDVKAEIEVAKKETANAIMKELQVTSPKRKKGGGAYRKGWAVKKMSQGSNTKYVVYNRTRYQLTHLLEHGHAKRNGGRVQPFPHIQIAEDRHFPEFIDKIERAIEK
jgi:hypothetical protein